MILALFVPDFTITWTSVIALFPCVLFLILLIILILRKGNFELVKAELSITNPKLYFELNKDKQKEELILENGMLKEEVKALQKKNSTLSVFAIISLILALLSLLFKRKK